MIGLVKHFFKHSRKPPQVDDQLKRCNKITSSDGIDLNKETVRYIDIRMYRKTHLLEGKQKPSVGM
jgi:hypothetical protein